MGQAEGQHVARMVGQDLLPDRDGAVRRGGAPGVQRGEMGLFARGGCGQQGAGAIGGGGGGGQQGGVEAEEGEIPGEAVRQAEPGIGVQDGGEPARGIGAVAEIAGDRMVPRRRGGSGVGGEVEALGVVLHGGGVFPCRRSWVGLFPLAALHSTIVTACRQVAGWPAHTNHKRMGGFVVWFPECLSHVTLDTYADPRQPDLGAEEEGECPRSGHSGISTIWHAVPCPSWLRHRQSMRRCRGHIGRRRSPWRITTP